MKHEELLKAIEEQLMINRRVSRRYCLPNEAYDELKNNNNLLGRIKTVLKTAGNDYERGCEDAWEFCRKLELSELKGGFPVEMQREIFDDACGYLIQDIVPHYKTYKEILAKVEAYEKKKKEEAEKPVVGDVINYNLKGFNRINTGIFVGENSNDIWVITSDHDRYRVPQQIPKASYDIKKTGKHFDIQGMLDEL